MMISIDEHKLISFPDCIILKWSYDEVCRNLIIETDGAFINNPEKKFYDKAVLVFSNLKEVKCKYYDNQCSKWVKCNFDFDYLKDICECEFSENKTILRGFGQKNGKWMEVAILESLIFLTVF